MQRKAGGYERYLSDLALIYSLVGSRMRPEARAVIEGVEPSFGERL